MKVLVATTTTKGKRLDDFSSAIDGELVFDAGPCEDVIRGERWDCSCSIAFRGLASGELTTTAMVADLDFGLREYERAFRDGLARMGCCTQCAKSMANSARMLALRWPIGTVIERNRFVFTKRAAT